MPSTLQPLGLIIGEYDIRYFQPTAAQTFKYGDWLIFDAAGTVSIAATAGQSGGVGSTDLVGMSLGNAADVLALTDTKARRVPVCLPRATTEFVFPYLGSAATATPTSGTLALTDLDVPTDVDLIYTTTSIWAVSSADTTNPHFRIVGLWGVSERDNQYSVASVFPYVRCRPVLAAFVFLGA